MTMPIRVPSTVRAPKPISPIPTTRPNVNLQTSIRSPTAISNDPMSQLMSNVQGSIAGIRSRYNAAQSANTVDINKLLATPIYGSTPKAPTGGSFNTIPGGISGKTSQIIKNAMSYLGTPYVWGGTSKQGIDCSGLIFRILRDSGIPAQRLRASGWGQQGTLVAAPNARPGDLVYFNNPGATDHVGLYIGNGKFIEAQQKGTNVMISNVRSGAQFRRLF